LFVLFLPPVSWILSFRVHVKPFYRTVSYKSQFLNSL